MTTSTSSISQKIAADIHIIDELLGDAKKQEGKNTVKELKSLLIDYILAEMEGNSAEAEAIGDKIGALLTKFGNDIEKANEFKEKLQAIAEDPKKQTAAELVYLQNLIPTLLQDAIYGEMKGF